METVGDYRRRPEVIQVVYFVDTYHTLSRRGYQDLQNGVVNEEAEAHKTRLQRTVTNQGL